MPGAIEVSGQRIALTRMGYFVGRGKKDKSPAENKGWMDHAKLRDVAYWQDAANYPTDDAANTLLLLDAGILAVDIDIDNDAHLVNQVMQLAMSALGETRVIRRRPNSTRAMIFYRVSDYRGGQQYKTVKAANGGQVELRTGSTKYAVVYGEHKEGGLYYWDQELKDTHGAALTQVTYEQVKDFRIHLFSMIGMPATTSEVNQHVVSVEPKQVEYLPMPLCLVDDFQRERQHSYALACLKVVCNSLAQMGEGDGRNLFITKEAFNMATMHQWFVGNEAPQALYAAAIECGYVRKKGDDVVRSLIGRQWEQGCASQHRVWSEPEQTNFTVGGKLVGEALAAPKARRPMQAPAKAPAPRGVVLREMSDVDDKPIQWHWKGFLPAGLLTLLVGAGGTGKSTVAFGFAATVTTGGCWPDNTRCTAPGNVLIWSSEDDVASTIKPRLRAAGADITKIQTIEGEQDEQGYPLPFDPATQMDTLREAVRKRGGVSLLIIDPIVSAVNGDMHKANDVRRSLNPIVEFAKEFGCAVIGISHFSKNTSGRNAAERVIGSQAFGALARMVLVTAEEQDTGERVFTRAKTNISPNGGGFGYSIEVGSVPASDGQAIETTRIVWGTALKGSAESILHDVEGEDATHSGRKIDDAVKFLIRTLQDGPIAANAVTEQAIHAGISPRTLKRARQDVGIEASKANFGGHWIWSLPLQHLKPVELLRG